MTCALPCNQIVLTLFLPFLLRALSCPSDHRVGRRRNRFQHRDHGGVFQNHNNLEGLYCFGWNVVWVWNDASQPIFFQHDSTNPCLCFRLYEKLSGSLSIRILLSSLQGASSCESDHVGAHDRSHQLHRDLHSGVSTPSSTFFIGTLTCRCGLSLQLILGIFFLTEKKHLFY